MPNNQVRRLSDIVPPLARQGQNDRKWELMEHQVYQAVHSWATARFMMEQVCEQPENSEDYELAEAVLELTAEAATRLLGARAALLTLMGGTERAKRIGGDENG